MNAPHQFVPSPNPRHTTCVKCGRQKAHPVHAVPSDLPRAA